jgi:uncharacterized protein
MKKTLLKVNKYFEQIPDKVRQKRILTWILFVVITIFLGLGIGRIKMDVSMQGFFKDDEPVKIAYDRFRAMFGSDESVYLVYEALDGDVFSEASLKTVQQIQDELLNFRFNQTAEASLSSPLNHIVDINSIINVSYLETRENALISRDFIGNSIPVTEEDRELYRKKAEAHPDYPKLYFSENFQFGGILIKTDFGTIPETNADTDFENGDDLLDDDIEIDAFDEDAIDVTETSLYKNENLPRFKKTQLKEYVPFMQAIETIINQPEYQKRLKFHAVGNPPLMAYAFKNMGKEMGMIMMGSLFLIIAVLMLLFRSFSAVLWPVIIIITSLVWTMGLIGWSGIPVSEMINIIVFLVLAVGVADSVHILSGYVFFRNQNQIHQKALNSVFKKSGLACFLTSITTSVGLLAMMLVPIVPMQRFGAFAAISVFIAFILTIFYLPLMLDLWGPVSKKKSVMKKTSVEKSHWIQKIIRPFETFSFKFQTGIIVVFGVLIVILLIGIPKIKVESNSIENMKDSVPLKSTYKLVDKYLGGTGSFEILIDTGKTDGLKSAKILNAIDKLQHHLKDRFPEKIVKTLSIVNITKNTFQALYNGDPEKYIIPDNQTALVETLFMFNNANPKDRRLLVSDDYRMARISINSKNIGSIEGLKMMEVVWNFLNQDLKSLKNEFPNLDIITTGQLPLQLKLMDYMSWSQIQSFGVALLIISLILLVVFGSFKIGIIAIIPNLFPIITAFGIMGYLKVSLDVHTLLVVPIVIGIAVDDTIHFITHFEMEMAIHGNIQKAIIHAFREAGQAIIFTSLVLSIGFLIFLMSDNKGFSYFGLISAVSIMSAMIADLSLLPAILHKVYRPKNRR